MTLSRREFISGVSAAAALSGVSPASLSGVRPVVGIASKDDPLGVRSDFPVVEQSVYLDSAYITPSPLQAVEAAQAFAEAKARDPVSLGGMLQETNLMRQRFATLIGASEMEIGVLFATSDGENIVSRALDLKQGDNVVIDDLHYDTTYLLCQQLAEQRGLEVRIVNSEAGGAPVDAFAEHVDRQTRLISVAWVSHQNGFRHDLAGLADLAHSNGAYLYADAIQGIGALDVDVRSTGIDFFTAGTYKWLLGGYGVAPFYVREELLERIGTDRFGSLNIAEELGQHRFRVYDDARKYGYATMGFGSVFQLRAALDYLLRVGVPNIEAHTVSLAQQLNTGLVGQGHDVWTPKDNRSPIVTFRHHRDITLVRSTLEEAGIRISFKAEGEELRAGIALFNNSDDIDKLLDVTGNWA
ncbi:MAG TPA: aminotransferase class V-fold PLP-dependent enzyme [Gemmatimonadetes bacterium]|nr:aminotransferase class V-fold PLP-dependent enzyme [Gemmatimonadota bacterium]